MEKNHFCGRKRRGAEMSEQDKEDEGVRSELCMEPCCRDVGS